MAAEYSEALGRTITYVDVPMAEWRERKLSRGLPDHVASHMKVMAQLHADNRYDRLTHDFEAIIGRPATSIREYVANHPEMFDSTFPQQMDRTRLAEDNPLDLGSRSAAWRAYHNESPQTVHSRGTLHAQLLCATGELNGSPVVKQSLHQHVQRQCA